FAAGHALIEGRLAAFQEDPKGRVVRIEVRIPGDAGVGLVVIYKDGPVFEAAAFDADGRARPGWSDALRRRPLNAVKMKTDAAAAHDWTAMLTRLAPRLGSRRPHAIAAVVVRNR